MIAKSILESHEPAHVPTVFRRHHRARRYSLQMGRDGEVVVTIPRGGSKREAMKFVAESGTWIENQQQQRAGVSGHAREWKAGTEIYLRGERARLEVERDLGRPFVRFGDERVFIADAEMNLRRPVEQYLLSLARHELAKRTRELASELGVNIHSVSIRNQSSRWGSCSSRGVISLNWRLVQAPLWVRDYLIVHELMHRREMNHSIKFWRLVAAACPRWREAEAWLDTHAFELGF